MNSGTPRKVKASMMNAIHDLPLLVARDEGFFADEGLDVEIVKTPGTGQRGADHQALTAVRRKLVEVCRHQWQNAAISGPRACFTFLARLVTWSRSGAPAGLGRDGRGLDGDRAVEVVEVDHGVRRQMRH